MTRFPDIRIELPEWVHERLKSWNAGFVDERMRLVIELARMNVERGTGGPFAAAVFDAESGVLIAPGVNLVVPAQCSSAHAEIVALSIAQKVLGTYDLGGPGHPVLELVSSTEPCAMCLGAVPWSGVRRLVCGARDEDARAIGMDEGEKPADWQSALARRGITVVQDVLREAAAAVLIQYARGGGEIYNSRSG